jgi:hypothetical protein
MQAKACSLLDPERWLNKGRSNGGCGGYRWIAEVPGGTVLVIGLLWKLSIECGLLIVENSE